MIQDKELNSTVDEPEAGKQDFKTYWLTVKLRDSSKRWHH